jgi:hypothetical protein
MLSLQTVPLTVKISDYETEFRAQEKRLISSSVHRTEHCSPTAKLIKIISCVGKRSIRLHSEETLILACILDLERSRIKQQSSCSLHHGRRLQPTYRKKENECDDSNRGILPTSFQRRRPPNGCKLHSVLFGYRVVFIDLFGHSLEIEERLACANAFGGDWVQITQSKRLQRIDVRPALSC